MKYQIFSLLLCFAAWHIFQAITLQAPRMLIRKPPGWGVVLHGLLQAFLFAAVLYIFVLHVHWAFAAAYLLGELWSSLRFAILRKKFPQEKWEDLFNRFSSAVWREECYYLAAVLTASAAFLFYIKK